MTPHTAGLVGAAFRPIGLRLIPSFVSVRWVPIIKDCDQADMTRPDDRRCLSPFQAGRGGEALQDRQATRTRS